MEIFFGTALVLLIGVLLALRILIFRTMEADQEAQALLEEHLIIQQDLLFWSLWRIRNKVASRHKWKVSSYFWLNVIPMAGALLWLVLYWAL